ncbi:MAG: Co2+/Mg2+ efflux protein ApaG [Alphaproteobacteria bacterium]
MYESETRDISVSVEPAYLDDQSEPENDRYVWAYHIEIHNHGSEIVQLLTRHWVITDSRGRSEIVRGDGVVGEQPVLKPGESFEYTSGAPLNTPSGLMYGTYGMETAEGEIFDVTIPPFSLDSPFEPARHN